MQRLVLALALSAGSGLIAMPALAEATVHCKSRHYQYDECWAGPVKRPQLIHQISNSACILNKTWGYNPQSNYIWVAQGCEGVFADVGGYHHGRGGHADADARAYDDQGHDVGSAVGGMILGALIEGAAENHHHHHRHHHHATSNVGLDDGRNGCHGTGCLVDDPDGVDATPQFDKDGNPNFDTHGNYQGCHGMGCLIDNPDAANGSGRGLSKGCRGPSGTFLMFVMEGR